LFQIEAGKKVFLSQGIDISNFKETVQDDSCIYESPTGESCAAPNKSMRIEATNMAALLAAVFVSCFTFLF